MKSEGCNLMSRNRYWGWLPLVFLTLMLTGMYVFKDFDLMDRFDFGLEVNRRIDLLFYSCLFIAVLGIFVSGIWDLFIRRWIRGIFQLIVFAACALFMLLSAGVASAILESTSGPSEDGFADQLTIPANISVAEPENEIEAAPGGKEDGFQQALMTALVRPQTDDTRITASLDSLNKLAKISPDILKRYLAASPSWRLFKENEKLLASRRWMIGSTWMNVLNEIYERRDFDAWSEKGIPDFGAGLVMGFSVEPRPRYNGKITRMKAGQTRSIHVLESLDLYQSQYFIDTGDLIVAFFERSPGKVRQLTRAALAYMEKEFAPLAANPTWDTIETLLCKNCIHTGTPSFNLINGMQPGIYNSQIWINPGEPGRIHLKAFEVTHETPLSDIKMEYDTCEYIGWSTDPSQLFFSNTNFTIYEGDWGKPYAARLEIWFTPDSGKPDRKLMEKIFKIEGWQR